ncbi:hypothetical protein K7X08_038117 [Anisodus acutangulus]|uniref:Uncharacterized protein n=1 Tax=Anisodus acutangulus TaxID=402998 RepID=A0A9Q1N1B9_9SOLA|nr:hypothetical protein K7X08_038117 [Anisodus acutangulus]
MAQLPCDGHRLIGGMDQSILVSEQSGIVELIVFTYLHGTNVRLPDGRSFPIAHWLAGSQQVVTTQRVHDFPDKLVKLCRDNEQVFGTDYIDASWIDTISDSLSAVLSGSGLNLDDVLNDKVLYSWGGHSKDVPRQVNLFNSCIVVALDFATETVLMGVADNRVSEEFVFLMQNSSHLDTPESSSKFLKGIPDAHVFSGLVKNWLLVLQGNMKEYLHARFIFRSNLIGSSNQIYCNRCSSFSPIIHECILCISCRSLSIPVDDSKMIQNGISSCPENGIKLENLQIVHLPIHLSVIDNTPSQSHVWIILGASYIISLDLSSLDYTAKPELNAKLLYVLCGVLHSLAQSLVYSFNQFPSMAFNLLVDGYLVMLGFLLELGASTVGIFVPLLLLLPFLFILQQFEAYVGVLLLQMAFSGFRNVGHELALILEETRDMYLVTKGIFLHCGRKVANGTRHSSGNVFNMPNSVPKYNLHNHRTEQGIVMIPTDFGISFATTLKNQTSTFVGCKSPDLNLEDKVLIGGRSIVTNITMMEDSFGELANYVWLMKGACALCEDAYI